MNAALVLAALGYFVDVFDMLLFSIVRVESLKSLGLSGDALLDNGILLLNCQMTGMLLGGIFWGVLGDKYGRLKVLFGSILTYSLATLLNGFVTSVPQYAVLRFLGGLGLAGELGAGITLVSELMDKNKRGLGTTFIATLGVAGAVAAALVAEFLSWRHCYFLGGALGLLLLVLRLSVFESSIFKELASTGVKRGNFFMLFATRERFYRYMRCLLSGLPIWFVVGILITFSPEFGAAFGMTEIPKAGRAILYAYIGFVAGDLCSGLLSQVLRSRKKALLIFHVLLAAAIAVYLDSGPISLATMYSLCAALGFTGGYWAVFITNAAEQFGTNLRATVSTTAPNFVRGSLVPISLIFDSLKPSLGIINSAYVVGLGCVLIAALATHWLSEPFGKDLNFVET